MTSTPSITQSILDFLQTRHSGMTIADLVADTERRAQNLPRRKADIQQLNVDRRSDLYLFTHSPANGLIQQYGAGTSAETDARIGRLRQEVFRRPNDLGAPDSTVMKGIYVDRESYGYNVDRIVLYRFFLEPLGVSVDKWSMGVRARSGTYTFADVFSVYINSFIRLLEESLGSDPISGLSAPYECPALIDTINSMSSSLPPANAIPTYTDVQRIFNKACIECHGGLQYPPYKKFGSRLDLSEDENPKGDDKRLTRSHARAQEFSTANPATSPIYKRIAAVGEECPYGVMPCGGPPLSKADIETIRRWIEGGRAEISGHSHIKTISGVNYDFQSAGEFVLLREENLEIQARLTPIETDSPLAPNPHTGLTSCVSVTDAVAIRVGDHRVTYGPNIGGEADHNRPQLRIDGKLTKMGGREVLLESGGRIVQTTPQGGIQVESPGGTVVVITPGWWNYYRLWYMNIDVRHARATRGVMGDILPGNWLPALPDGTLMGPRPTDLVERYRDLYVKFANAWRVSNEGSLFDYARGTSTKTFTMETWPGEALISCRLPRQAERKSVKLPQKQLPLGEAAKHCSAISAGDRRANCVEDVKVTGEAGFAKTYQLLEQMQRKAFTAVPVVVLPEDFKTDIVAPVAFTWSKTSSLNGDRVTYRHCVWDVDKRYTFKDCSPVSSRGRTDTVSTTVDRLESGKAYFWKVIAEDGKGGSVESETRRFTIK